MENYFYGWEIGLTEDFKHIDVSFTHKDNVREVWEFDEKMALKFIYMLLEKVLNIKGGV